MTKLSNLKVKRVKSNLKYTESKLIKKDHVKRKKKLKKPLSYRYHVEKGITLKGNTQRGITQRGNTQKASRKESTHKKA